MTIPHLVVCGRDAAERVFSGSIDVEPFDVVLSIHGPTSPAPLGFSECRARRKLELVFEDVSREELRNHGWQPVTQEQIEAIICLSEEIEPHDRVLVHCAQGVSRSSAAALVIIAAWMGPGREGEAVDCLEVIRRQSWEAGCRSFVPIIGLVDPSQPYEESLRFRPNCLMVEKADKLLTLEGRLIQACDAAYPPRKKAGA